MPARNAFFAYTSTRSWKERPSRANQFASAATYRWVEMHDRVNAARCTQNPTAHQRPFFFICLYSHSFTHSLTHTHPHTCTPFQTAEFFLTLMYKSPPSADAALHSKCSFYCSLRYIVRGPAPHNTRAFISLV
uniref:SCP domain-containing protein n=1 Tax=Mesocestoides corti TaxID=53468 RepID=A0A5K3FAH4_MESCO